MALGSLFGQLLSIWREWQEHVPSEVAAIFTSIETDNVSIIDDMLDAALAMPAEGSGNARPSSLSSRTGAEILCV